MAINLYFFIYQYADRKNCFTTKELLNQQKFILENFKWKQNNHTWQISQRKTFTLISVKENEVFPVRKSMLKVINWEKKNLSSSDIH